MHYAVPFGFIAHPLLVRGELMRIFGFRHERMSRIFTPVSVEVAPSPANGGE